MMPIQTDDANDPPYRQQLWRALTTPLPFTFDVYRGGSRAVLLDASLEGDDSIVIAESIGDDTRAFCHVWDYSSGQSLQRVAFPGAHPTIGDGGIRHMVQCGKLLVVATRTILSVWNWSGEQLCFVHSIIVDSMHAMGDSACIKYVFVNQEDNTTSDKFAVLDLATPENIHFKERGLTLPGSASTTTMFSFDDTLLISSYER